MGNKWIVIIRGPEVGVFSSWIEAGPKTKNVPGGAIFQGFATEIEATQAFEASKARGEVEVVPAHGISTKQSKTKFEQEILSPMETEAELLMSPHRVKSESASTGRRTRTPLSSSPVRALVDRLHQLFEDSTSTSSSPPTEVTQRESEDLEDEGPVLSHRKLASPAVTIVSDSSQAYPDVTYDSPFALMGTRKNDRIPRHELSSKGSRTPAPPSPIQAQESSDEEPPSTPNNCEQRPPASSTRRTGVRYVTLEEIEDSSSIDSRIWLPSPRVFDPTKVKPRPATRPPSPTKQTQSPVSHYETPSSGPRLLSAPMIGSPFVRVDRGRATRLTQSLSLPALPTCDIDDDAVSSSAEYPANVTPLHDTPRKEKGKLVDRSASDEMLVERPLQYPSSPRQVNERSHIQMVQCEVGSASSTFKITCLPGCCHKSCLDQESVYAVDRRRAERPRYVDAAVSPIIVTTASRVSHQTTRDGVSALNGHSANEEDPYAFFGLTAVPHASHRGFVPEVDVRSPIVKGTKVPATVAERHVRGGSGMRRLTYLTPRFLIFCDPACFVAALTMLTHAFCGSQNIFRTAVAIEANFKGCVIRDVGQCHEQSSS
ncbi:hypothetical protein F5I97DRAFT_1854516 [Phlebopus sp. FC_14]|nr:hypothetical protein F5I97DRAFT_1854516 [Phlebopus sp. FC_14]